jgi:DNA-binding NtrC family response regulator
MRKQIQVLVLDDEAIVCERLKEYLEKKGILVETFTDSVKALEKLKEKTFDVIITDMKMQGPTGMDVLVTAKKEGYRSEVIIITGYGSFETFREAEYVGAFEFISKPFQMSDIYNIVKKAAKKARKRSKDSMK